MSDASIPTEVAELAAEIRYRLARDDLDGQGPVELAHDVTFDDAAQAARIVLADVDHCAEIAELGGSPPDDDCWRTLAEDLRVLRRIADRR